jgi:hypothetical protein
VNPVHKVRPTVTRHPLLLVLSALVLGGLGSGTTAALAAAGAPSIGFSSKTTGFEAVNARQAGSVEYALVVFKGADGVVDATVPVTLSSSNPALLAVTAAAANPLGNFKLQVPAQAPGGSATVTASATVGGVVYSRSRSFTISPTAPAPLPPGASTMVRASTPTTQADQSGCAAVHFFDVGPGQAYTALGQLPWSQLKGCDTVRIYPKANNAPYHEMILISAGTNKAATAPNQFMRVLGMPDPVTGVLPIIDGGNATQLETLPGQAPRSLQYHDGNSSSRVLYRLGLVMVGPQQGYDYNFGPTGYIAIENLDLRNVVYDAPFADAQTGSGGKYHAFGACLFVEAAAHLVVRNNRLHNCGNGLFINSKNGTLLELSQDVLVDGNRFYDNGNAPVAGVTNGFSEHNSYTEARDITFQHNFFGDMRPGAHGDCLKDRSSGLVVRYNTFASNCGVLMYLPDATGGAQLIWGDPGYAETHVYGNLFDMAPVPGHDTHLLLYGGDSGQLAHYRQGSFHYYNNTLVLRGDATHGIYPEALLFSLDLPGASADVRNNIFYTAPTTVGSPGKVQVMALGKGTVNLANNWVSPNATMFWIDHLSGALINGWGSNLGANNAPMFVNEALHNWRPAAGSPLLNAGNALGDLPTKLLPLAHPGTGALRPQDGAIDIGAFER